MATIHTLQARYANVMRVPTQQISTTDNARLAELAGQVDSGALSLQGAVEAIVDLAVGTTSVADIAYQFFTGAVPRAEGLDYLVNPWGPNPNNLNSAYYQTFSTENRYINFAVNLGRGGEDAAAFEADYGALSIAQTVTRAYTEIFGAAPDAAKVDALINGMVPNGHGGQFTRLEYFATYGLDGVGGLGTKAAFIGWLLSVAAREGLGPYAQANEAFLLDLAGDGEAAFEQDMLAVYGPDGPPAAGATIAAANNQSVSPTASDPALKSTPGDDTVTGAGGLDAVQSVLTGAGDDVVTFAGAAAGLIDTGAGDDQITVAVLPAAVEVLGGAENGLIRGGDGDDVITVTQDMAFGARIDGGAGEDTAIVAFNPPDYGRTDDMFSNIEHLVITQATGYARSLDLMALGDLRDIVFEGDNGFTFNFVPSGLPVTLRDVSGGTVLIEYERVIVASTPVGFIWSGASSAHVRLDGTAAPAELAVGSLEGPLHLTVDSDSALAGISGAGRLVISGPGVLTVGEELVAGEIDASAAAGVNLAFFSGGLAILSPGGDAIAVDLLQGYSIKSFTLGEGADTLSIYQDAFNAPRFFNMRIEGQTVTAYAKVTDFEKGVDHLDLGAQITALTPGLSAFVGAAASLEAALVNVSPHLAANATGVFEYGGSTFIYHQDATVGANTGDGLIQLVGVTGLTTGTGAGDVDIHYG
ncbi:MAG: hypothetical protein IT546_06120 [Caulobacteraceae bacterium]|nr:hypothetical protein [Caulobacteraceae bacterium]